MTTTATRPRTRKSDVSRAVARVLGHDSRSAAHGWDVYDDGVRVIITLNYTLRATDREAFEDLQDSPLAQRYRLHYTPVLLGDDYEHMPADYEGCGVIDLTRREQPTTPATTTQEAPAVPATPTVSVTLPEPFCSYLDMTPMIESNLTETPEEEALVDAYATARPVQNKTSTSRKITTHSTAALDALIEHADRCADSLAYESTLTEEQAAELKAARTVSVRARDALKSLRTAQEAAQAQQATEGPQDTQEAPTAPQGAPVPVEVVWMHREDDRLTGMLQLGPLTPADNAAVEATGKTDQAHITGGRRRATLDAFSDYNPADGWTLTRVTPEQAARHLVDWLGFTGRPIDLKTIDETR